MGLRLYWYCWVCNADIKKMVEEMQLIKLNQERVNRELDEARKIVVDNTRSGQKSPNINYRYCYGLL